MTNYSIQVLSKNHIKKDFRCQHESLQRYIRELAKQDSKRNLSMCYVLVGEDQVVTGYYTLSNTVLLSEQLPGSQQGSSGNAYKQLPATLIGRLAVDDHFRKRGFGKKLLLDGLLRSYEVSQTIASFAVVVDYLDIEAKEFYLKFGFIELDDLKRLYLPMESIKDIFS